MKTLVRTHVMATLLILFCCGLQAQTPRLLSQIDSVQAPAGGGGDSWTWGMSPDARYVLFASTANNLLLTTNGVPIPLRIPPSINVYLRDRLYGTNALVSVNLSGVAGGNGDSLPAGLSPDGRYVVFESAASDLVPGDANNASDVFVRDLVGGTTTLVSAATNGVVGNGPSRSPAMTPDGRYVAFVSAAFNLVPRDTNRIADVFVRDLQTGTTVLASVGAVSTSLSGSSEAPDLSADGRYVAFYSSATNLVPGARLGSDIYIRDLSSNTTIWASTFARTAVPSNNVSCFNHAFSADGHYLAYEAAGTYALFGTALRYHIDTGLTDVVGTNATVSRSAYEDIRSLDISSDGRFIAFVANFGTTDGATTCIKLWDAQSGLSTIVSGNLNNSGVPPGTFCDWPALDATGRYLAFLSSSTNMVTNATPGDFHLYFEDTQASSRMLIDADTNAIGAGLSPAAAPQLNSDARFLAFDCADANFLPNDRNRDLDVFLSDLSTGAIGLISAHDPALPAGTANGPLSISANCISADGRYLAFASEADNLAPLDTNKLRDVFVRDLGTGIIQLVSADTNGLPADGTSTEAVISADGRFAAFTSLADNLVAGDTNRNQDVFVRDLQGGTTILASVNTTGFGSGNNASFSPVLSSDGRYLLFRSKATNLAPGTYASGSENLFLRDLQLGHTYALTTAGGVSGSMTPDGRLVAVLDTPGANSGKYYLWDSALAARVLTNTALLGISPLVISPDGTRVAYWAGSGALTLYAADIRTGATVPIVIGPGPTAGAAITFSANSQVLAYTKALNGTNQVYAYDFASGSNTLLSADFTSAQPAYGASDSPALSPDGRFVAYRSAAPNIIAGDTNGQPDIFLFDRQTGTNALLSANRFGTASADNRSLMPVFCADGSILFFESWASDISPGDFNHANDLFACTFLNAVLLPGSGSSQAPVVSWPWVPGSNYRVEYNDDLAGPAWHELSGNITNFGVKAFLQDPSAPANQRFYRIKVF